MKIKLYAVVAALVLVPAPAAAAAGAWGAAKAEGPRLASSTATALEAVARDPAAIGSAARGAGGPGAGAAGAGGSEAGEGGPGEWAQAGFGGGNTYYNPGERRLNGSTIGGVARRWEVPLHSWSRCEVGVGPVVAGGGLFVSDPGGVGRYDAGSGKRRWHVALPRTTVGDLAVVGGKLLVLSSVCDVPAAYESHLTAFELGSGKRLWEVGLAKFTYDLRVDRGVAVMDIRQTSTVAYRVADGKFLWLREGERGDGLVSAGGRVLLRTARGGARAVDVTSGKVVWETGQNWYAVGSDPAGKRFYIDGPGLSAVEAGTGKMVWTTGKHVAEVTADANRVCFARARTIECVSAATGQKVYTVHTPQSAGRPVRAGGLLYVPSGIGSPMTVADAATGEVRKIPEVRSNANHPPVVSGGWLYVSDGDVLRAYY